MPISYQQLIPANAALPGYVVAQELARQTVEQFGAVRGIGVGIGMNSCCAAVALVPAPGAGFPAAAQLVAYGPAAPPGGPPVAAFGGALPCGIAYGNSQLAMGGLAMGPLGGHAERAALTAAAGLPLYVDGGANAVLFVELMPCANCQNWLNGVGGGVPNPYNGVFNAVGGANATTLNVWWRWEYPAAGIAPGGIAGAFVPLGGIPAMNQWHGAIMAPPGQLSDINANW
jgi:hypothetical protein